MAESSESCAITEDAAPEIGPEQLDVVLQYLTVFEEGAFAPGEWREPEGQFRWFSFRPEVEAFVRTLYEQGIILPFDWPNWTQEAEGYQVDPGNLDGVDLLTLRKLLTVHVRADRFAEGHLASMFENGHIVAILRRLRHIRESMLAGD